MRVNQILLVTPDGADVELPRNSEGKLFLRTYIPAYFATTLDGKVDLKIPVHGIHVDGRDEEHGTTDLFGDVEAFHRKFNQPVGGPPHWPEQELIDFRLGFLKEEVREFEDAVFTGNMADAADALADLVWVALGTACVFGIPFPDIWREVARANMKKVRANADGDSRSKRNAKFDIVKPDGWKPPDHREALRRAGWNT